MASNVRGVEVSLEDGSSVVAQYVIGADGSQSTVRHVFLKVFVFSRAQLGDIQGSTPLQVLRFKLSSPIFTLRSPFLQPDFETPSRGTLTTASSFVLFYES
ncbi:hypothetical protein JB92DRAFT_3121022 [Gautieria morchelliformis]|nr:hypothetical protein JB92DRAFT_3121022 [Gautieria morchelliformis]